MDEIDIICIIKGDDAADYDYSYSDDYYYDED